MPVTTRLQERRRELEASENSRRSVRSPAPSPVASSSSSSSLSSSSPPLQALQPPGPFPSSSSSPSSIHSSPPLRLPRRLITPLINIHGRRSLTHTLHHFRGDITTTSFPAFPHLSPLYVLEAGNEDPGTAVSNAACYASDADHWDDELPDYVSDEEYGYEYPSPPGASPVIPRSSSIAEDSKEGVDIGDDLRGIKRKRSDEGLLTGVEKFLDNIAMGAQPTLRAMIDPRLRSPSLGRSTTLRVLPDIARPPIKKQKIQQLDELPMHPRAKGILQRLQASYIATRDSSATFAPSLSPVVELPEKNCCFYDVASNARPADPHWVPEWPIHAAWPGSFSPKISPTGNGNTLYAMGCKGKKRKFEDVRSRMRIENVLNPEPEGKRVKTERSPGFREVVTGIEWQRLHHGERERVRYGTIEEYRRTTPWDDSRKRSPVREPEMFDPRWKDGVNRAHIPNVFASPLRR